MACKSCESDNLTKFNGEIAIHVPGLEGLKRPIVWVFPKLVVCLHCGMAEFAIPKDGLRKLSEKGDAAVSGTGP